jgi:hypothetical protein
MAVGDIFRMTQFYELPTSAASWSLYYEETVLGSTGFIATEQLGEALFVHFGTTIIDMLSADCNNPSMQTERVFSVSQAKHVINHAVQIGVRPGPSLPNNNSIVVNLAQATLPANHNGSIRLPGIPEADTNIGNLAQAYFDTQLTAFLQKVVLDVNELSAGDGIWQPIVISAQIRDIPVPPAPKDWAGAKMPITGVSASPIIGILRKRATRVHGRST